MHYLYELRNKINNKVYIGRTVNPAKRYNRHINELKQGKHHCIHLQREWIKYSYTEDTFEFKVLDSRDTLEEISELEEYLLNHSTDVLYNVSRISSGGDLISYHPNRDEIVRKNSEGLKRHWRNLSAEKRVSYINKFKGENNPNYKNRGVNSPLYGIPLSKEHRENISKALTGRKLTDEQIKKLKDIGFKKGNTPWNKGLSTRPLSEETKSKLSESLKGRKPNEKIVKPVICEGYYFDNLAMASRAYNVSSTTIINRIKSSTEQFKDFYYFDKYSHDINDYKIYKDGININTKLKGININRKVYCEGEIFNSIKEATSHYNFPSHKTIVARCESKSEKWKDFYYID